MIGSCTRAQVISIVSKEGLRLKEFPLYKNDEEVVIAAIRNNPFALRYSSFLANRDVAMVAAKINGYVYHILDESLKVDPLFQDLEKQFDSSRYVAPSPKVGRIIMDVDCCFPLKDLKGVEAVPRLGKFPFYRDSMVNLLEGNHLVPSPITDPFFNEYLLAILPATANHFNIHAGRLSSLHYLGQGFDDINRIQAKVIAYELGFSFESGITCIEGGNCFVFLSQGIRKAIVGEISLYLSLISIEENKGFKDLKPDEQTPSENAFRIARNLELYNRSQRPFDEMISKVEDPELAKQLKKEDYEFGRLLRYKLALVAPVSTSDKIRLEKEALMWEAKIKFTRAQMAKELKVEESNLLVVPQIYYHLDWELCVMPSGELILNDFEASYTFMPFVAFLRTIGGMKKHGKYLDNFGEALIIAKEIDTIRLRCFASHKLTVHRLPSIFKKGKRRLLNYCNALFLNASTVVFAGPSDINIEEPIHNQFVEEFKKKFPSIKVITLPNMSTFQARMKGGLHCLSIES